MNIIYFTLDSLSRTNKSINLTKFYSLQFFIQSLQSLARQIIIIIVKSFCNSDLSRFKWSFNWVFRPIRLCLWPGTRVLHMVEQVKCRKTCTRCFTSTAGQSKCPGKVVVSTNTHTNTHSVSWFSMCKYFALHAKATKRRPLTRKVLAGTAVVRLVPLGQNSCGEGAQH